MGLLRGDEHGSLNGGGRLTRIQLALLLGRAAPNTLRDPPADYKLPFTDVPAWATRELRLLTYNGILSGVRAGIFDPYALAKRGQVAKAVSLLMNFVQASK
jgi:hypothetical protein